jgi:hypothetical protein
MCFSPSVSFIASAGLAVVGILTLRKVTTRRELLFASIPLLFATQQFIEGMLWIVLLHSGSSAEQYWLTLCYSVFVGMIWPILGSLSIWLIEPSKIRKHLMTVIILIGVCIALYALNGLIQFGVTSRIAGYCILYKYPVIQGYTMLISYVAATCGAFLISSHRGVQRIGVVGIIAFFIAYRFYHFNLVSVWCLFAAVVSGLICFYFHRQAKYVPKPILLLSRQ